MRGTFAGIGRLREHLVLTAADADHALDVRGHLMTLASYDWVSNLDDRPDRDNFWVAAP